MAHEAELKVLGSQVEQQLEGMAGKEPSLPTQKFRQANPAFVQAVGIEREALRVEEHAIEAQLAEMRPAGRGRETPAQVEERERLTERLSLVRRAGTHLDLLLTLRGQAWTVFDEAVLAYEGASAQAQVYTAEAHAASQRTAECVTSLRTAVADSVTGQDAAAREVREKCGIGQQLTPRSPLDTRDLARRISETLGREPALVRTLEAHGVDVAAFHKPLQRALVQLETELAKAPALKRGTARERRDAAQLRVEVLTNRILAQINAARGVAARDAVKDTLPKPASSSHRRSERHDHLQHPAQPGPVASGTAGQPSGKSAAPAAASEPTVADGKVAEGKVADSKVAEGKAVEGKAVEGKAVEGKAAEAPTK